VSSNISPLAQAGQAWQWPIDLTRYDRCPTLSSTELAVLDSFAAHARHLVGEKVKAPLRRLILPIQDVYDYVGLPPSMFTDIVRALVWEMQRRRTAYWGWELQEWKEIIGTPASFALRYGWKTTYYHPGRHFLPLMAYLLDIVPQSSVLIELVAITSAAQAIFGKELIPEAVEQVVSVLRGWGFIQRDLSKLRTCVSFLLVTNRSPYLQDLSSQTLETVKQTSTSPSILQPLYYVSRALHALSVIEAPLADPKGRHVPTLTHADGSLSEAWFSWCQRWLEVSTLRDRKGMYYQLLKVGRWLKVHHPEVSSPADVSYELAAELVAAVNQMKVGEWIGRSKWISVTQERLGDPLRPTAKRRVLEALRTFIRDCQEWGWIPVTINAARALRTPTSVRNLIGPNPRVVDPGLWAKLLWAAMNLQEEDLPRPNGRPFYPVEMVRAIAVVWCFAALRSDDILRLRVGCIRGPREDVMFSETGEALPKDATCFLDIPVSKTMTSYTKPVHPLVGQRINEWERIRPSEQLRALDSKTSEKVQFLFSYRGTRMAREYLNVTLIPLLCRKAGIPQQDSRGNITSHRARATIASMLYSAKEPLDIFQLKEYLGHKQLSSTQHYLKVDPTKLASKVAKAGYLEQNLATIEVLLDQEAVLSGAASRGEAWKYYDLGHGWCTNPFWASCAHRMACAKCPFYRPKTATMEQLVEGKANLVHMLEFVSLTEDEKLLVTEGIELHQELIEKLADVPTPAGPTPRELENNRSPETKVIPLQTIRRNKKKHQVEP
jgi:integrase